MCSFQKIICKRNNQFLSRVHIEFYEGDLKDEREHLSSASTKGDNFQLSILAWYNLIEDRVLCSMLTQHDFMKDRVLLFPH